ncbi:MAG: DUF2939 domain-containing protein [Pseudomonadota bacterium]
MQDDTRRPALPRLAAAAALILVLALAAWWWWSPHIAVRGMRAAAQAHDTDRLNQYVDYPRVRENMKAQFAQRFAPNGAAARDNPLATLGASVGLAVAGGFIDTLVQPEVLIRALDTGELAPNAKSASAPAAAKAPAASQENARWHMARSGANRVVVSRARDGEAAPGGVGFVFERSGFASWKMTDIRLPGS